MSDKAWKAFERWTATMLGGARFWANSGQAIDCEGPLFVAQCKLVRRLSLEQLVTLALAAQFQGRAKRKSGIVVVKQSGRGGNVRRPALFVMTEEVWRDLHGPATAEAEEVAPQPKGAQG